MDFYSKYLKYKSKYLGLKNNFSFMQNGGALVWKEDSSFEKKIVDICKEKKEIVLDLSGWVRTDIDGLNIIKKSFEEKSDKPVLVVMAGISAKSFCGSAEIVVNNVKLLKDKYKAVYIINTAKYGEAQGAACNIKDAMIKEIGRTRETVLREDLSDADFKKLYEPERLFTISLAKDIHKIITERLELTNVHLLGKCQGGSNMLELIFLGDIYKALYLAVPGNAYHIKPLYKLSRDRLEEITFIFGWNKNDDYKFDWTTASFNEKAVYDEEIGKLEKAMDVKLNYESYVFTPGNGHEINSKLIEKIAKS
jgi:hypothetical protein